jgi:pimeloyl-ACP methyl ester carboxylesterase
MPLDPAGTHQPAGDEVPFSWDELSEPEQRDLTPELRHEIEQAAVPFPAGVVRDGWDLSAGRRFAVPALVVASGFDEAQLDEWRRDYPPVAAELDAYDELEVAWLPTSHWPHLTRPDDLVEILLDAVAGTA